MPEEDDVEFSPADMELLREIASEKSSEPSKEFVDWDAIRLSSKIHWTELVDDPTEPFPVLLPQVLKAITLIPDMDRQAARIMAGLSMYSVACSFYPIFACVGKQPGIGKSKLCELVTEFYEGVTITGSDITASGIKRKINQSMFHDPAKGREISHNEKSTVFVFDDIMPQLLLRDEGLLYTLLKRGIERNGTVEMASRDSPMGIITFYVGCPKWISSISKFWLQPQFSEMHRRIIWIEFKHYKEWKEKDFSQFYSDCEPENIVSISDVDWSGLPGHFKSYWNDPEVYTQFAEIKGKIRNKRKHGISKEHWQISTDLIATGVTCGYWENLDDAIADIKGYWEQSMADKADARGAAVQLLEVFIQGVKGTEDVYPVLNPKDVKAYLDAAYKDGGLDINPNPRTIEECMSQLNYRLGVDDWGLSRWFPVDR